MLVVIVTDNGFAAEAIRCSFRNTSGVRVAGYVDGRRACGAAVAEAQPDVVIVDEMTWSAAAVERIAEVHSAVPSAKIVALTSQPGAAWVADAARAGADASIAKTVEPGVLGLLVREIWAGTVHHAFAGTRVSTSVDTQHASLTPRELEILRLVAGGASNGRIAGQLWVTEQTVKFHLSNVYRKLGVSNRTEASHYAHINELLDLRTADAIRTRLGSIRAAA
jgi:DNA-binding NarL/FixJ family response regulator